LSGREVGANMGQCQGEMIIRLSEGRQGQWSHRKFHCGKLIGIQRC